MRVSYDPKQRIKRMSRRLKDLGSRAQELERRHRTLAIQHHVLTCCCELLQWMRSSAAVHEGWLPHTEGLLPDELPLLEQLTSHPINQQLSNPEQQPGLLELLNPQSNREAAEPPLHEQQQQQEQCQESNQHSPEDHQQQQEQQQQHDQQQQQQPTLLPAAAAAAPAAAPPAAAGAANPAPEGATTATATATASIPADASPPAAPPPPAAAEAGPPPAAAAAAAASGSSAADLHSLLFIAAPGDFLGPMRESFSQPPHPGVDLLTLQQWGGEYNDLVDVNAAMLDALERMQAGEQVQGVHPVAVMRARLMRHVRLVASVLLLHPDDLLNKVRLLNHNTMQLEENCSDQAWCLMWNAVDHLDFTEQQQDLIAIGCDVFKCLITSLMQERQALATRQQELLQLHNGRSVDLQQQQACAERLALVVRKERFLSQCLGTFVTSICSVLQIAKLTQLFYPYCPQIAVLGAVLTKKLQEREVAARQEQEQRRRRRSTHGLNIP